MEKNITFAEMLQHSVRSPEGGALIGHRQIKKESLFNFLIYNPNKVLCVT